MESLQHLLILCCYGGVPYIDYLSGSSNSLPGGSQPRHESTKMMDPTDWIAVDSSGSLLNSTIHPEILAANPHLADLIPRDSDIPLDRCDLYNLTFSSFADEQLYGALHGTLICRCPKGRTGRSCQLKSSELTSTETYDDSQIINLLSMNDTSMYSDSNGNVSDAMAVTAMGGGNNFAVYLVLFLFFMIAMAGVFMMMRGCFCDCFGGFKNPFSHFDRYDRPLDVNALNRCLEAVKAHEQNEKNKYVVESRRPLISSVSENCPYNPPTQSSMYPTQIAVPPSNTAQSGCPRPHSPPPSYKSLNGSLEVLPTPALHTRL